MFEKFKDWLALNKAGSKSQYASAYKTIERILEEKALPSLSSWSLEDWDQSYGVLISEEEFKKLNTTGHNNLTSALSAFKKFLEASVKIIIPPTSPGIDFKWRWAVTTPSEGLNRKDILIGVLKILVQHDGERHATQDFRNDLIALEDSITDSRISLSKKEDNNGNPRPLSKNIIENSGQYWKALGLIESTADGTINVSNLGKKIINEALPDIEFIKWEIEHFTLPNARIESSSTIKDYKKYNIRVQPIKLIFQVLLDIVKNIKSPTEWYLTIEELKTIIVPLSIDNRIGVNIYREKILEYRENPTSFASWPNYTPEANDLRMLKEYFLFLKNFGALTEIEPKGNISRFYANEMTLNLMNESNLNPVINKHQSNFKAANTIYFGSPGTGKSHTVSGITNDENVSQITFHPEYDYHSFVGSYKPSMNGDDIVYKFVPQIFTKIYVNAWQNPTEHYYLQIEEINRGNCAEVFGDLFQLLDRDSDGSSKYNVDASDELLTYLTEELGDGHEGIAEEKIKLPNNLSIIATMNTSDQSLFPMDSAFKRRWDWEYMKIDYDCPVSNFEIKLNNGNSYEWLKFLEAVNRLIFETTGSPDKQIGNWFINATDTDGIISEKTFINKVLFYLWNDVFKDEDESLFDIDGVTRTYEDFFIKNTNSSLIVKMIDEHLKLTNKTVAEAHPEIVESDWSKSSDSE